MSVRLSEFRFRGELETHEGDFFHIARIHSSGDEDVKLFNYIKFKMNIGHDYRP